MSLSLRSFGHGTLVVVLLGIPVLLLHNTSKNPHELSAFDRSVRRVSGPLQAAVSYSFGMLGAVFERWVMQSRLQDENERLAAQTRELQTSVRQLAAVETENRELRRALGMRERMTETLIAAERVGVDLSPFFRVFSIRMDRGEEDVRPGMAVLSPDGVVGRVDKVFDAYSDVMLITDPRSKIAVEVGRSHARGILRGSDEAGCVVDVSKDDAIEIGDIVQTSGGDALFPRGHPLGTVSGVEQRVGDAQRLHVTAAVRFDRVDVMWVVAAGARIAAPRAGSPGLSPRKAGSVPRP